MLLRSVGINNSRHRRFLRYFFIGIITFLLDLWLSSILIESFGVHLLLSVGFSFFIAISLNFFLSRRWVFHGSERNIFHTYIYFIQIAVIGVFITISLMWILVTFTPFHYILSRVLIAGIVGVVSYLGNLRLNFRVADKELG